MLSRLIFAVVACAALVAPSAASSKRVHENYHTILQERYRLGLSIKPEATSNVTTHILQQPLDHFDRYNTQTYNQTYWVNDQFLDVGRPVGFIFLGGEWEESSSTLEYGANIMSSWAKNFGGIMLDIQHRYYDNVNPSSADGEPRYLNSMQALADAARVVKHIDEEYRAKLNQPIKWVVTSGSYGGIMAATFRLRYPELTVGAVAISAPVTATLAYNGFFEVAGRNINKTNPACLQTVRAAVKELDGYLDSSKGWTKVNSDFKTNIASDLDAETWAASMVWYISSSICEASGETPYEKLVNSGHPIFNATYISSRILDLYGTLWAEQICAEWSFFQTGTDFDTNPLQIASRHASPRVFMEACSMFGFTPAQVEENIRWTNVQYGGKDFTTTNTMFTNGNADLWSAAGITEHVPKVSGNHIYIIDEGNHCSDLYWPSSSDSKSLVAARAAAVDAIKEWIKA